MFIWSPERVALLVERWPTTPIRTIAIELGTTYASVKNKAPRLGLDPKPSPIKRKPVIDADEAEAPFVDNVVKLPSVETHQCVWPIGDPLEPDFRFCGASTRRGKPYCDDHAAEAYPKFKRDKPNAA